MQLIISGYLVVLLRHVFAGGLPRDEGEVLEVQRQERNNMIAAGVARDATDAEVEAYRAEHGGADDAASALVKAQAQLKAVEAERDALQTKATALEGQVGTLTTELAALKAKGTKGKPAPADA